MKVVVESWSCWLKFLKLGIGVVVIVGLMLKFCWVFVGGGGV